MKMIKMKFLIPGLIGVAAVAVIVTLLITGGGGNKTTAEKFLKTYYTVENSAIYDQMFTPNKAAELEAALKGKYGDYATDRAIDKTTANREILSGEKLASEKDCTISVKSIDLSKGVTTWNEDIGYTYVVKLVIKYSDDTTKEFTVDGNILMTKDNGKWKVNSFGLEPGWANDIGE